MQPVSIFIKPTYDYVVWEANLSRLVQETYGRPDARLQAWWEAGNGTYHVFDVSGSMDDPEWTAYALNEVELWSTGCAETCDPEALFWDMYGRCVVPAGRWLVEVWW